MQPTIYSLNNKNAYFINNFKIQFYTRTNNLLNSLVYNIIIYLA